MANPNWSADNWGAIPVEKLPGLLERARARLPAADYRQLEQCVRIFQRLDELHLLGLPPEQLVAGLEAAVRRLDLEAKAAERQAGDADGADPAHGHCPNSTP